MRKGEGVEGAVAPLRATITRPQATKAGRNPRFCISMEKKSEAFATRFLHADEADGEKSCPIHNLRRDSSAARGGFRCKSKIITPTLEGA